MPTFVHSPAGLTRLVRWQQDRPGQAAFYAGLEDTTGTVRVMGAGAWTPDDADRYFEQQKRIVAEARRRYGRLRVFFDVRHWVVESPQSALMFQEMNTELYRPDDRLVAVVSSSLYKQHPRTALAVGNREVFISLTAAETWLQAYAADKAA